MDVRNGQRVVPIQRSKMVHEFVVQGAPPSLQRKRATARNAWKERVAGQARDAIAEAERFEMVPVSVTILQFAFGWNAGDLDNIAKPILDGMTGPAFSDDRWVTQLTLRRTELDDSPLDVREPPPVLARALRDAYENRQGFVYIRVEPEGDHEVLPWAT